MIPNDQPLRYNMIERMLAYLMRTPSQMENDREIELIESFDLQFRHKGDLSNKQCEILERIYDK